VITGIGLVMGSTTGGGGAVAVTACTRVWQRTDEHCFALASWQGVAQVRVVRSGPMQLSGGVRGLQILLTAGSGFSGFLRDELTTQRESTDRPLCGSLDATWTYSREQPTAPTTENLVTELLSSIAGRSSNSIQQLLTDVGEAVLAANEELATLALHFQSAPISALPPDLAGVSGGNTYEVGSAPVGITRVALRRS
jgi:urate oxidase